MQVNHRMLMYSNWSRRPVEIPYHGYDSVDSMRCYESGLMVGPLMTQDYAMYRFNSPFLADFCLLDGELQKSLHIQSREPYRISALSPNHGWCLLFPRGFNKDGLLATITSVAACLAIRKESKTCLLARWECLVDVTCFPQLPWSCPTLTGTLILEDAGLLVESGKTMNSTDFSILTCHLDMTQWPKPTPLNPYLNLIQAESLLYTSFTHPIEMGFITLLIVALVYTIAMSSIIATDNGWKQNAWYGCIGLSIIFRISIPLPPSMWVAYVFESWYTRRNQIIERQE